MHPHVSSDAFTQTSLCTHTHSCTGTSRQEGPHPKSPPLGTPSPAWSHTLEHETQPQPYLGNACERVLELPVKGGTQGPRSEAGTGQDLRTLTGYHASLSHRISRSRGNSHCSMLTEIPLQLQMYSLVLTSPTQSSPTQSHLHVMH